MSGCRPGHTHRSCPGRARCGELQLLCRICGKGDGWQDLSRGFRLAELHGANICRGLRHYHALERALDAVDVAYRASARDGKHCDSQACGMVAIDRVEAGADC